jgi:hypothetical protein
MTIKTLGVRDNGDGSFDVDLEILNRQVTLKGCVLKDLDLPGMQLTQTSVDPSKKLEYWSVISGTGTFTVASVEGFDAALPERSDACAVSGSKM